MLGEHHMESPEAAAWRRERNRQLSKLYARMGVLVLPLASVVIDEE